MSPASTSPHRRWIGWVGLAARLLLGGVLLVAGALKVGTLGESVLAVRAYQLLPYELTEVVGTALPFVEILLGLLLVTGTFTRLSAILGALLMAAFTFAIASAWARGLTLDCGCFGGGGEIPAEQAFAAYPWEIARDLGLVACGAWLDVFPRTPFSLDSWIFHTPAPDEAYLVPLDKES
ncbi:MAG: MauE/DoxX family redox-associated membrane protein [Actinomycetes bacterium]